MKRMKCPLNGLRNIAEFIRGGEVTDAIDPRENNDREWAEHIFMQENKRGVVKEWWMHTPSSYWFIVERNTITNEIIKTYPATNLFNVRIAYNDEKV